MIKISKVTKGDIKKWEQCPLRLWKEVRGHPGKQEPKSRSAEEGSIIHEMIKEEIFRIMNGGEVVSSGKVELNLFNVEGVMKARRALKHIDIRSVLADTEPIAVEQTMSLELRNGIMLVARPDFVGYKNIDGQPFLVVYDWKTGAGVKRSEDVESILYSLVAYKTYGIDANLLFGRINVVNGLSFFQEYYLEELEGLEEDIAGIVERLVLQMESEEEPEPTPGGHCVHCPYLERCRVRKNVCDVERKLKALAWADALKKKLEGELKEYAKEYLDSLEEAPDEGVVVADFCGHKYAIEQKVSEYWTLPRGKKKGVKKEEIPSLLLQHGKVEALKKLPVGSITDEVAEALKEIGVDVKKARRESITIKKGD